MILRETLTLPYSNSHQHERNDREKTRPPALRIERHSCRETNQGQRDWPDSNCRQVEHDKVVFYHDPSLSSHSGCQKATPLTHYPPFHPFIAGFFISNAGA
nr:MAG TPA: hypothetical protein [Caudoviricetes sp.]